MPTVLRQDGYRFMIYLNDHTPAHVHVRKAENDARVQIAPVLVVSNEGFNTRELRRIEAIVKEHQQELLEAWDQYHESR